MNSIYKFVAGLVVFFAFSYWVHGKGYDMAEAKYKLQIAALNADIATQNEAHAKAKGDLLEAMRQQDKANADAMAAIDARHQKEIADHEAISNRTIADLRAGTLSLRDKFTCSKRTADSSSATAAASTGQCDAAASLRLQQEDSEFLVLIGRDADRVADQLRACQAIVTADRKGQSKP